uniref:FAD/NAD(P)-binding domain-containing protein n=1 Tax=Plectus sambesii TaxID=2011161 RepID=A0A914WSQ1_9BILA
MTTPRLVILGSGWGSYSVLKNVNKSLYQVIVVTPRNHFLFTPLLCSTTVGTLEFRSIIEPVRNIGFEHSRDFHLASTEAIDFRKKEIVCRSAVAPDSDPFTIPYDKLVVGVGALPNTFNVPGVEEHSYFLKEIADARKIRTRLLTNFERALEPTVSEEEKQRLTHIVIVGGGPTGVEFGAELYDFCRRDMVRLYKDFGLPVKVSLVESHKILASFDKRLQAYAEKKLSMRENFTLKKSTVTEVRSDCVVLKDGSVLPCGLVVWSTGLAPRPLTASLDVSKTRQGQILVDNNLNIVSDPSKDSWLNEKEDISLID